MHKIENPEALEIIEKFKKTINTRADFYNKIVEENHSVKELLDEILFPKNVIRGTYFNFYQHRITCD